MSDTKEKSMQTLTLALQIADRAVRTDIEIHAEAASDRGVRVGRWLDTSKAHTFDDADDESEMLATMDRAVRYLRLRGPSGLDFAFEFHPEHPEWIRFNSLEDAG